MDNSMYVAPAGGWMNGVQQPGQTWAGAQLGPGQNARYTQNGGNFQQPVPPQTPFVGRFVKTIAEIVPNEVPMDGRIALFPTESLEEIYLKAWTANGEMKNFRYILDPDQNLNGAQPQQENMQQVMLARIDALEKRLAEGTKNNQRNNTSSKGGDK